MRDLYNAKLNSSYENSWNDLKNVHVQASLDFPPMVYNEVDLRSHGLLAAVAQKCHKQKLVIGVVLRLL